LQIEVKNPSGICKGVKRVTVDGKSIAGNVIPFEAGKWKRNLRGHRGRGERRGRRGVRRAGA
jgi:cellobiose phosphorylase